MVGPPADREDDRSYFETFFQKEGMRVVCGGTTAKLVADYLKEKVVGIADSGTKEVPAMSKIKGIDLVTEGLLTLQKVIDYYEEFKEDRPVSYTHLDVYKRQRHVRYQGVIRRK